MSTATEENGASIFWNLYAYCYDVIAQLSPYQEMLEAIIQAIMVEPGQILLNAGCGTGNLEAALARSSPDWQITSLDFSSVMLQRAKHKPTPRGTRWMRADLDEVLSFGDEKFDVVTSINCIYALPRPEFTLGELYRVLKPGGRIVMVDPVPERAVVRVLIDHLSRIRALRGRTRLWWLIRSVKMTGSLAVVEVMNAYIMRKARSGQFHFRSPEAWQELMAGAGFDEVTVQSTYSRQCSLVIGRRKRPA